MTGYFVTGTDTGAGKTRVSLVLMHALRSRGLRVAGMKPVATGAVGTGNGLNNDDALRLKASSSLPLTYEQVNPFAYEQPVSPHIAARIAGRPIELKTIVCKARELESLVDILVVEGIGGWEVPLGDEERLSDLAVKLALPVILVVGLRLGCLNHSILTYDAIVRSGLECVGWIANRLDPDFDFVAENVETLRRELPCRHLGCLPFAPESGRFPSDTPGAFPGNTLDVDEFLRRFNG